MIKAVLFDLDGTFADTAPDLGAALNHVLSARGRPPLPLHISRLQASHGSAGLLKLGFGIEPTAPEFPPLRDMFLAHYATHICDHTTLFPGMTELVATLESCKIRWGIVTNKPHRFTVPLMQKLGYAERAACLVSGDTCMRAKPYPDPLLHAANLMQIKPSECLYLGDDKRDMQAGRAAGMTSLIALFGYIDPAANLHSWEADGRIANPLELLEHVIE